MQTLKITLEWFINPDHLPMIAGIQSGRYAEHGIDVQLIEPSDHYDGFHDLLNGNIDLHSNEPLHLFEHHHPEIRALGCFFETDGGVLLRRDRVGKLQNGETVRICTPAAEPKTNRIGYEILRRYAEKNGFRLPETQIEFVQADFHHIDNLLNNPNLDGAWLCFYNFEAIEAKHKNLDFLFIDQHQSPFANFSALELMSTESILTQKGSTIAQFLQISSEMTTLCQQNPQLAKQYYYAYTQTQADDLMDAIIDDTLPRLVSPIRADAARWQNVREMMAELGLIKLTDAQYAQLFSGSLKG